MSPSATKIIHPDALWFATGNEPIVKLSGATEHVSFCGKTKDPVDMLLISPCTANTISKIVPIANVMNAITRNIPFDRITFSLDLDALPAKIKPIFNKF